MQTMQVADLLATLYQQQEQQQLARTVNQPLLGQQQLSNAWFGSTANTACTSQPDQHTAKRLRIADGPHLPTFPSDGTDQPR